MENLEKAKALITKARERLDQADAEPFGKLPALLDSMAIDLDAALRLLGDVQNQRAA